MNSSTFILGVALIVTTIPAAAQPSGIPSTPHTGHIKRVNNAFVLSDKAIYAQLQMGRDAYTHHKTLHDLEVETNSYAPITTMQGGKKVTFPNAYALSLNTGGIVTVMNSYHAASLGGGLSFMDAKRYDGVGTNWIAFQVLLPQATPHGTRFLLSDGVDASIGSELVVANQMAPDVKGAGYSVEFPLYNRAGMPLITDGAKTMTLHIIEPAAEYTAQYTLKPVGT